MCIHGSTEQFMLTISTAYVGDHIYNARKREDITNIQAKDIGLFY